MKRLGCRAEYWFRPTPPRNGGEAAAAVDAELERYMHLAALNRGILLTPFHNMALIAPAVTEERRGPAHRGVPRERARRETVPLIERCLWTASAGGPPLRRRLGGAAELPLPGTDVAIIGGGYTGLSAARVLARGGADVAVLERHTIGWGASSRNGGFVLPGYKPDIEVLARRLGIAEARRLFGLSVEAVEALEAVIADEAHRLRLRAVRHGRPRGPAGPPGGPRAEPPLPPSRAGARDHAALGAPSSRPRSDRRATTAGCSIRSRARSSRLDWWTGSPARRSGPARGWWSGRRCGEHSGPVAAGP